MDWLLRPDTVNKSIRAAVLAQVATLLVCYAVWVWEGCDHFMPFISDTDTHPSSGVPFTIGFTLSGLLLTTLAWQMFRLRSEWIESKPIGSRARILNTWSAIFGAMAGLFIVWIAYTPWDEDLALHLLQARVIFGGSILWAVLSTMLASEMASLDGRFQGVLRARRDRTVLTVLSCVLMGLSVLRFTGFSDAAALNLEDFEAYVDTVEVCTDLHISSMSMAALFEWAMVLGLIGVLETGTREVSLLTSHESDE